MTIKLSLRAQALKPAATLAISAEAKARKARGEDIVNFGAGEPDFDTPEPIKRAAIQALERGFTKYTNTAGMPELREAIAAHVKQRQGLGYDTASVLVSAGAKHSLFNLCQALIDPGDEALIPAPYWLSYPEMVQIAGGVPRVIPCAPGDGFQVHRAALEAAVSPRTCLLILNSPNNPTGAVLEEGSLREVVDFVRAHPQVTVISDDIYERLTYGTAKFRNVLSLAPELATEDGGRVILVSGFSKTFSMTGWRIGYTLGPKDVIVAMQKVQDQSTSNPTSFAQSGALAALTADQPEIERTIEVMRTEFDRRRLRMLELLGRIPGLSVIEPRGAFYALPSIEGSLGKRLGGEVIASGESFCKLLLARGIAAIPGEPFGAPNRIRLSFALSMEDLERGLARLGTIVKEL